MYGSKPIKPALTLAVAGLLALTAPLLARAMQSPPDEEEPPTCYDEEGYQRPCTPNELLVMCRVEADARYSNCMDSADGFWDRVACRGRQELDRWNCYIEWFDGILA